VDRACVVVCDASKPEGIGSGVSRSRVEVYQAWPPAAAFVRPQPAGSSARLHHRCTGAVEGAADELPGPGMEHGVDARSGRISACGRATMMPMLEAIVAVVAWETKFLFIRRGPNVPNPGFWAPLSGNIEPGEDQASAVIREAREEVGLAVKPLRKVWECLSSSGTHRLHWWLADWVGGDLALEQREVSEARWLTLPEIRRLEGMFERDREFFEKILPGLEAPP